MCTRRTSSRFLIPLTLTAALAQHARAQLTAGDGFVCLAEGTSSETVAAVQTELGPAPEFVLAAAWPGAQGSPRTLTWSFVPDGLLIPSGGSWDNGGVDASSELFSRFDGLFGGNRPLWIAQFQASVDRWEELTGIDFVRITAGGNEWDDGAAWGSTGNSKRGDIRIAARNIDGSAGVLAWAFTPSGGGDLCLDRSESWKTSVNQHLFLRNVLMHEIGHSIGLLHVCAPNSNQLMEPYISTSFDGPQRDDLRGAQALYGDPAEDDNSVNSATHLGVLPSGKTTLGVPPAPSIAASGLYSIDATGESDHFRLTLANPASISIELMPKGGTYQAGPLDPNGSCSPFTSVTNASAAADLALEILNDDGTSSLAVESAQPAGAIETVADLMLPAGDYVVRVFETGVMSGTQLYRLSISVAVAAPTAYCTAGASAGGCSASLSTTGSPSASASSGFLVSATGVEADKDGLFFFGTNGRQAAPWGNGTSFQCVAPPVQRGGLLEGGGIAGSCAGTLGQDLNSLWANAPAKNPGAGATVQLQLWFRDPFNTSNQTTSLSNALEFSVGQ